MHYPSFCLDPSVTAGMGSLLRRQDYLFAYVQSGEDLYLVSVNLSGPDESACRAAAGSNNVNEVFLAHLPDGGFRHHDQFGLADGNRNTSEHPDQYAVVSPPPGG